MFKCRDNETSEVRISLILGNRLGLYILSPRSTSEHISETVYILRIPIWEVGRPYGFHSRA